MFSYLLSMMRTKFFKRNVLVGLGSAMIVVLLILSWRWWLLTNQQPLSGEDNLVLKRSRIPITLLPIDQLFNNNQPFASNPDDPKQQALYYCNPPNSIGLDGLEGSLSQADYSLETVHILTRHGDRTPMSHLPGRIATQTLWSCKIDSDLVAAFPDLADYTTVMSSTFQGLKTDSQVLNAMPYFPDRTNCLKADLTPYGAAQHIQLGQYFWKVYVEELKLLSPDWQESQLNLRTSIRPRTLQSALAFLYGFLPNFDFAGFSLQADETTFCGSSCNCPARNKYTARAGELKDRLERENADLRPLMFSVRQILRTSNATRLRPLELFDVLMAHACHAKPLQCGTSNCLTRKHFHRIVNHIHWLLRAETKRSEKTRDFLERDSLLTVWPFLSNMVTQMLDLTSGQSGGGVKFSLYSGHDTTLQHVMRVLGITRPRWAPYASRLVFELWRERSSGIYYVCVLYNGLDLTGQIHFCKGNSLCPLSNFSQYFISESLTKAFGVGVSTYEKACRVSPPKFFDY